MQIFSVWRQLTWVELGAALAGCGHSWPCPSPSPVSADTYHWALWHREWFLTKWENHKVNQQGRWGWNLFLSGKSPGCVWSFRWPVAQPCVCNPCPVAVDRHYCDAPNPGKRPVTFSSLIMLAVSSRHRTSTFNCTCDPGLDGAVCL